MSDSAPGDYPLKPDKGCWANMTPLEAGLCLVLLIAIPFLITLIIIYITFGVTTVGRSTDCMEVCGLTRKRGTYDDADPSTEYDNYEDHYNTPVDRRRFLKKFSKDRCEKSVDVDYPFTAALLEQLYVDSDKEVFLKCIAAVLSSQWVLTTSACIDSMNDFKYLNVRVGSKFWPQGGSQIGIKQIKEPRHSANGPQIPTLVAIQLLFRPRPTTCVKSSVIPLPRVNPLARATEGVVFVWHSNWTYPLRERSKYRMLEPLKVTVKPYRKCPQPWGPNRKLYCATSSDEHFGYCVFHENGPIFSKDMVLMGVQVKNYCHRETNTTYYYYEDISYHVEWLVKIGALF